MQAKQPTLETVRFLQREGLDKLCQRFTVSKKRHQKVLRVPLRNTLTRSQFPNLVLFKYDQVRANFSSRIVRECRGRRPVRSSWMKVTPLRPDCERGG